MNRKAPLTPLETDALLYVIISVLLLMTVNQVLGQTTDSVANLSREKDKVAISGAEKKWHTSKSEHTGSQIKSQRKFELFNYVVTNYSENICVSASPLLNGECYRQENLVQVVAEKEKFILECT